MWNRWVIVTILAILQIFLFKSLNRVRLISIDELDQSLLLEEVEYLTRARSRKLVTYILLYSQLVPTTCSKLWSKAKRRSYSNKVPMRFFTEGFSNSCERRQEVLWSSISDFRATRPMSCHSTETTAWRKWAFCSVPDVRVRWIEKNLFPTL